MGFVYPYPVVPEGLLTLLLFKLGSLLLNPNYFGFLGLATQSIMTNTLPSLLKI